MHAKNNRQNSDFQIAHFLVGSCHTPDGAYALLCDLKEDRINALNQVKAGALKKKAKTMKYRAIMEDSTKEEWERIEAEAELAEMEGWAATEERNIRAAEAELATIEHCMAQVQPLRKFAHLPDPQAHQAAQQDEWREELIYRAENFMLTGGGIPPDHFATMRQHPDFAMVILPAVDQIKGMIEQGQADKVHAMITHRPFDLPKLLES